MSPRSSRWLFGLGCIFQADTAATQSQTMNVLFMADIGHTREHVTRLLSPEVIMGKSAREGAFSLYDGLADFVLNQGERPDAVLIAGDVGYGGGVDFSLNNTRSAFQKYLGGHVPEDSVFPLIGNHDVNYFGCMLPEVVSGRCYYGGKEHYGQSQPDLSYEDWRGNWLRNFPGLSSKVIRPANAEHDWMAPLRYNLEVKKDSSVYFIVGLVSGARVTVWSEDTPKDSTEGVDEVSQRALECQFLADSLAHGRSLGKTVFIYVTHAFDKGCSDWDLISQVDLWIYGHKHTIWQSADQSSHVQQEDRHYPIRILVGNGGFDEGRVDTVNFGRLREEVVAGARDGEERVKVSFDFFDTCRSTGCIPRYSCWSGCQDIEGGYDGGGGPRKALPTKHEMGFTFEAPRKATAQPDPPVFPKGAWKVKLGQDDGAHWLGLASCNTPTTSWTCLAVASSREAATVIEAYDIEADGSDAFTARVALDRNGGPILAIEAGLYQGPSFWETSKDGYGLLRPSNGDRLRFEKKDGTWFLREVAWQHSYMYGMQLGISANSTLQVSLYAPTDDQVYVV
eukprot:TRINITY_DN44595_c0_g1_i1.p1 TRINITY_DN44595_c0_g1~~TRINITY_DN44595_c0_g1_i1.p1  ORF type:complete len:565 (-),score=90.10 TRINITY_DN44595_c0_g1_i1:316-2010(-)